jgi:murein DD-endopeptidase MepM/ murein hydrolase activator NlpD
MPCAALFAPAGMLLVVILGVLPLMLPSSSAGSAVHPPAREAPTVARPEPNRILHLRQVDLSLAADSDPAAAGTSENAVLGLKQLPIAPSSERALPTSTAGVVVSRRGPSPIGEARIRASIHTPPAAGIPNAGRRLRLLWPSRGIVTSPFGWRTHPIFGTHEFHTGIDIGAQSGAPVMAAYPGTVRFVGWKGGYGLQIIVYHGGGLETAYSHLSAASVQLGAHVEQGQEIGRIGSTGWSTGPHLLFEVFENGTPRDPTGYLN